MKIKVKRKEGSDAISVMSCWMSNKFILFSLVALAQLLLADEHQVFAQTYCEESPKILFYRRGQAALVSGGGDGASEKSNHVVVSNVNKEFLACVSSRNVEWAYDGEGEPSKFQESSTVDIQNDDGSISYCLTSQITFSNKQSDTELSKHTGKYSCREIGNISNSASVYVFASRKNSPTFLQSRKTLTLSLSQENITSYPLVASTLDGNKDNGSTTSGRNNNVHPTNVFTIPCVSTHPNAYAKLLKKDKNNKFVIYKRNHQFDPKMGFLVNASGKVSEEFTNFYGEYKCISSTSSRRVSDGEDSSQTSQSKMDVEDFVFINLVKAKSFQIYPPVSEVYISGMLNLTCESEEPVIMKEVLPSNSAQDVYSYLDDDDYGRDRSDDIVETTERNDQKSHIANYMEIAPAPGRFGEIQCLTEKDGKVLHTWKYRIIRKRADKLSGIKFNKREKSFTCKSKLGAPGRLSFISCRTPSECRINRICLSRSENCRGYSNSTRAFCERKTHFCGKIFYKGGSGLIRCIGEGIDEIRGFTDEASVDHAVRMGFGKLKASETALLRLAGVVPATGKNSSKANQPAELEKQQIQNESKKGVAPTIYEGDQLNVTLHMGYYYFLYPAQWALKFRNGSTSQISPDSQYLQIEKLSRTVFASLTLPYTTATTFLKYKTSDENSSSVAALDGQPKPSEIIALHALIPLRASVDPSWKTISLPLTIYGKQGLPQPSTDIESEELLIEQPSYNQQSENSTRSSDNDKDSPFQTNSVGKEDVAGELSDYDESDDDDDEEEDNPAASQDQQSGSAVIVPPKVSISTMNETNGQQEQAINDAETTTKVNSNDTELGNEAVEEQEALSENEKTAINATLPVGESVAREKSPVVLHDMSSNVSYSGKNITASPSADTSSGDSKFEEGNMRGDQADKVMTQVKQDEDNDETVLLARSGLPFDDDVDLAKNTEKTNIEGENDPLLTTEIPSINDHVANDNITDDGAVGINTENLTVRNEVETNTSTNPSHIL